MTPERYRRIVDVLDRRQPDLAVLMEGVHKPHNLSAIQRSADAVGVLEAHAVTPQRRYRSHKGTAAGSEKWVETYSHDTVEAAIEQLQGRGFHIVAAHLSDRAVDFRAFDYTRPTAILLGTEKYGVSEAALERVDAEITIPMVGMVASLNVSVAAAVILYEAQRQRLAAGLYDRPRLEAERYRELLFRWGYPRLAERYQALGLPFPRLGEQGELLDPVPEAVRRRLTGCRT
ncbi:tRNA (guanosine(18)-2'-O)-methyltransferase TrmH [Thiohalobacter sp. IOR34]|uniref:tRNA (guanosine(18)-2'-O)-methyltransferase TrmH n=1 Tax=Thiohalobacter sp. IOR34 TaxID=3057176 RepID=UPI0025AFC126|nr:tRNA (guanosine(18)-2'-O)-methyltransferase TrmH [Thiohalobacter sp. IOR34]WJW76014.1 tRNA (guanosine(18)-2'-O)-methyltransferase TrmH [Thiohalobacter sp. IOR34]